MITDGKKWHYLALKSERTFHGEKWHNRDSTSLSRLLRQKTSNHNRDFHCLNCFYSYRTDNMLKNMKKYVKNMIIVIQRCLTNTTIH